MNPALETAGIETLYLTHEGEIVAHVLLVGKARKWGPKDISDALEKLELSDGDLHSCRDLMALLLGGYLLIANKACLEERADLETCLQVIEQAKDVYRGICSTMGIGDPRTVNVHVMPVNPGVTAKEGN